MAAIIPAPQVLPVRQLRQRMRGEDAVPVLAEAGEGPSAAPLAGASVDTSLDVRRHALEAEAAAMTQRTQQLQQAEQQLAVREQALSAREQQQLLRAQQLEAAQQELDARCTSAEQQAVQRGLATGSAQGQAAAEARHGALLQAVRERLAALSEPLGRAALQARLDAEDGIVEVVFAALCRLLGEAAAERTTVEAMVRTVSAEHAGAAGLRICLHPEDLALVADARWHCELVADDSIVLGGCRVESEHGQLDARLELALERLRLALLATRARRELA